MNLQAKNFSTFIVRVLKFMICSRKYINSLTIYVYYVVNKNKWR